MEKPTRKNDAENYWKNDKEKIIKSFRGCDGAPGTGFMQPAQNFVVPGRKFGGRAAVFCGGQWPACGCGSPV